MNIEEARKVTWISTNPRPMGELLDSGFLTRDRLEWAARKAYDPRLKEAAQVLLDGLRTPASQNMPTISQQQHTFQVDLPLDQARATLWPFSPFKGQSMGMLVESRRLTIKDLGYAIDTAWDERVKQAAITLLLARLQQTIQEPAPPAGHMKIISTGRSFAQRQETRYVLLQGTFFGASIASGVAVLIWDMNRTHASSAKTISEALLTSTGIFSLVVALIVLGLASWAFSAIFNQIIKSFDKKIQQYRLGQEGEERVVHSVAQALDGNWSLFRNVELPGRNKGDLDLILVGLPGIWVLEVKNFNGEYRNIGDAWELRKGKSWKKAFANPSRQAEKNAVRLSNFLKADRLNIFVHPVVVWANPESALMVENPKVAVWQYTQLSEELGNIWQSPKISQTDRDKVIEKLTKLCERQKV